MGVEYCARLSRVVKDSLVLYNGVELEADIVVLDTGYHRMKTTARQTLADAVASRLQEEWDLDEEGEINAMWRFSGHQDFWYMGGTFGWCRSFSKLLALQIKATEGETVYLSDQK
ncbi:hypothetical protein AAWM_06193 [Aspergillus awamori]|uniref:Uncharacterized protein n=1 Tax=Aspergillus awamori TaxID=105351 RepID=A0A401KVI9_ASPAW|nr:hypothetical protein AAWM_06193 [Aspergillus awamori]